MAAHQLPFSRPMPGPRLSSEGTPSDGAASEDAQTAMTSVADTDDDLDMADDDDDNDDYHPLETASLYPVAHHTRPASPHGTVMQPYPEDPADV